MDLEILCLQVRELAKETGAYIQEEQKKLSAGEIEAKGLHNYVTYVDTSAEKRLVNGLKILLPEAGYIAEEGTSSTKGSRYNWIIDPLDGTTNFIHGLPPYAISIALAEKEEIILGIIYEITFQECFYAWRGSKAYLNGKEIKVSNTKKVAHSLIATGFPYSNFKQLESFMYSVEYFMKNSHGLRRLGSAATDMAYVACGRFDAFYEYGLNAWDVAAAALIVEQAGGRVCDFRGENDYIFGKEVITTNRNLFDEFKDVIYNIMVSGKKL